jgi:hypothetical protein
MAYMSKLPNRFPVGTKFVIEGQGGSTGQLQIYSRYLEFPDGSFFPLPARPPQLPATRTRRRPNARHGRSRKA